MLSISDSTYRRVSCPPEFELIYSYKKRNRNYEEPKRHSWPQYIPSALTYEPPNRELVHRNRRESLDKGLRKLNGHLTEQCDQISDRLDQLATPATEEAMKEFASLVRMTAAFRLELDHLRAAASCYTIHMLSSFWVQSWKIVYEVHRRITEVELLLAQLDADYQCRQIVPKEGCDGDKDHAGNDDGNGEGSTLPIELIRKAEELLAQLEGDHKSRHVGGNNYIQPDIGLILEAEELLAQLEADDNSRQVVGREDCVVNEYGGDEDDDYHPDRLDGWALRSFVNDIHQIQAVYARTLKSIQDLNLFAFTEKDRKSLRQAPDPPKD
ncbi:hypothetical protein A1O3_10052 [Capronia epimyces CBS 606.96]|uniref:Uncharacterized protein n=1 Tax=Capronia epimyces CBS 606.96 TaxID=1182542 RepID=W9XHT6_9EURO|nr:uncharacterized protein A1O3_10052 [Capronia epimyces CBS 606.96]EXJ76895.1 hypothetical protein A1O3_10052 [Capronia epimyces CBS 606.96]